MLPLIQVDNIKTKAFRDKKRIKVSLQTVYKTCVIYAHIWKSLYDSFTKVKRKTEPIRFVREKYTRILKFLRIFFWEVDNFWYLRQIIEVNFRKI